MVTSSESSTQPPPAPVDVKVSVTNPAAISELEAVYATNKELFPGLNTPVPPLQEPPVAFSTEPIKNAFGFCAQIV